MSYCNRWCVGIGTLIAVALIAGFATSTFYWIIPSTIRTEIAKQTRLGYDQDGNLTASTLSWKDPRYHMNMSIYTFSVVNANSVIKNNSKPRVVERGPYVFREEQHKRIEFAENDTRVFYRNYRTYHYDAERSCAGCSLDDPITIPNIVLQTIIDKLPASGFLRGIIDAILRVENETAFVTTTVGQILFIGYEDPIVSKICNKPILSSFCKSQQIPSRVGLFYEKNGTDDGVYEVGTGQKSVWDIAKVFTFNNASKTNAYYGEGAREIKGTDGQIFPPGLDRRDSNTLDIFVGQLCRSIQMEKTGSMVYYDVPIYTYGPSRSMHDIDLQRHLGFCNPNSPRFFNNTYIQESGCAPVGIMDASSCLPGNPRIYISQPHFYGSHPAVHDAIDGLSQSSNADRTSIGIEPATSAVVYADQRTQLNLGVLNGGLSSLSAMEPRIIPIIWLQDLATFDEGTREQLISLTGVRKGVFLASVISFLVFCATVVASGLVVVFKIRKQDDENVPLLAEENEPEADVTEQGQEDV